MANWCSNSVEFIGEHSQFEQLETLFTAMAAKEQKEKRGQLPIFIGEKGRGHLFEIRWEGGMLYYETKWSPNSTIIMELAGHFGVDFIHHYEEIGCRIYGEATCTDGVLTVIELESSDYDQYIYDDDNACCVFENQNYDCSDEILEILFERKKAIINLTAPANPSTL